MNKIINRIIALIIIVAVGFLAWYFSNIIIYILLAAMLSFIGIPIVKLLDRVHYKKIRIPHGVNTLITLIALVSVGVILIRIFVPVIIHQASALSEIDFQTFSQNFKKPLGYLEQYLLGFGIITGDLETIISQKLYGFVGKLDFNSLFNAVLSTAGNLFIGVFAVLFLAYFFLRDEKLFRNGIMLFVPEKYEKDAEVILSESRRLLSRYFAGICIEVITMATLLTLGGLVLGLKNALLIGVVGGMFNVIPYLGPVIGAAIGAILVAATNVSPDFVGNTLPLMLGIVGVFIVSNLIDNILLQPLIYSRSVKAHPIEIFLIIIMAGTIAGIPGMILAIPVYTLFRIVARQFFSRVKIVRKLTEKM